MPLIYALVAYKQVVQAEATTPDLSGNFSEVAKMLIKVSAGAALWLQRASAAPAALEQSSNHAEHTSRNTQWMQPQREPAARQHFQPRSNGWKAQLRPPLLLCLL